MRLIVAGQEACTRREFEELALGVDLSVDADPSTGRPAESLPDKRACLDVAREVVHDLDPTGRRFAARLLRSADRARVLTWKEAA
ncbi:hypothetical protein [Kitasatospora kifunensis]|uniref:Uncharacterized protein n=1 Tax=Kitasatospora kifunensis TaxID=58351 RepID=A0A7W7R407_KITKI|nr:hypothetical protein [Kitasatospora kifunensis]MBB4924773.1 hypothetical protein [Kitasatospora kifunensis]